MIAIHYLALSEETERNDGVIKKIDSDVYMLSLEKIEKVSFVENPK